MVNIGGISSNDAARQSSSLDRKSDTDKKIEVTKSTAAIERVAEKKERETSRKNNKEQGRDNKKNSSQSKGKSPKSMGADISENEAPVETDDIYDQKGKKIPGKRIDFTV